jgi:predicted dehydrogenase
MSTQEAGEQQQFATQAGAPAPKRKIRVGIVGCGEVTQIMHWPSLQHLADRYEVTALCDVSPRILGELGKRWNVRHLTTDHRQLVIRPEVDAVLVANPNAFHAEVTLDAIAAGKHVLVEKPMCITRREAGEIMVAQKERNVVVQVGYMRRYAPAFLQACEAIRQMASIKFARVRDFIGSNALIVNATSRVVRDEHLPEEVKKDAKAREEALLEEALGGKPTDVLKKTYSLMLGLSSHDLSAMRELLGMPKGVLFAARRGMAAPGGTGIYLAATFDYGPYVCQFETGIDRIPRFDAHLEVYGEERVVRVQYDTPYVRSLPIRLVITEASSRGGVTKVDAHPAWGDPFVEEWKAFYENVTDNKAPKTSPADFVQDLELFAEMARQMREP